MFPEYDPNEMGPDNRGEGAFSLPYILALMLIMILAIYGAHHCFKSLADSMPNKVYNHDAIR